MNVFEDHRSVSDFAFGLLISIVVAVGCPGLILGAVAVVLTVAVKYPDKAILVSILISLLGVVSMVVFFTAVLSKVKHTIEYDRRLKLYLVESNRF